MSRLRLPNKEGARTCLPERGSPASNSSTEKHQQRSRRRAGWGALAGARAHTVFTVGARVLRMMFIITPKHHPHPHPVSSSRRARVQDDVDYPRARAPSSPLYGTRAQMTHDACCANAGSGPVTDCPPGSDPAGALLHAVRCITFLSSLRRPQSAEQYAIPLPMKLLLVTLSKWGYRNEQPSASNCISSFG